MNTYDTERVADGLRMQFSRPLVAIATASLVAGIVFGGTIYLNRSPELATPVDGTSAWLPHLVLFALAAVVGTVILRRRGVEATIQLLPAPVGTTAARRLGNTLRAIPRHPSVLLRVLLAVPAMVVLVYCPFRIGVQVLAGLDPNFTVNAWGGPTYLGAMACHYLDAALLIAAAAYLLNKLLLPATRPGTHR
ncbi:hypothetical protein NONI108955_08135 [Nocardia ninae]|uniref:Uncharacterized protein n=1 Tax=Nocardia ninae NBRC 108245 TaxID=1210091 RepID=A0A511MDN9_9NOCA|nr:hypothetical protein [Nocardia ninae]GEM38763.1 hypothetical protein NN4_32820 [Nocardia ninae NBRC 108245]